MTDGPSSANELAESMRYPNSKPRSLGILGEYAHKLAIDLDAYDADLGGFIEEHEGLFVALVAAVLDLSDAVRSMSQQPASLAKLVDAAPTAEALALLMRAAQTHQTADKARSEQA